MPKLIQFGKEKINDNCIVGFGNYDGFHLGHKKCIEFLVFCEKYFKRILVKKTAGALLCKGTKNACKAFLRVLKLFMFISFSKQD